MKSILTKIKQWTIIHQSDIILLIGVILISLLSFAMGYIVAKEQEKEPLKIEFKSHEFTEAVVRIYEFAASDTNILYSYIRTDS